MLDRERDRAPARGFAALHFVWRQGSHRSRRADQGGPAARIPGGELIARWRQQRYVGIERLAGILGCKKQPPGLKPRIYVPSVTAGLKTRSPGLKSGATPNGLAA